LTEYDVSYQIVTTATWVAHVADDELEADLWVMAANEWSTQNQNLYDCPFEVLPVMAMSAVWDKRLRGGRWTCAVNCSWPVLTPETWDEAIHVGRILKQEISAYPGQILGMLFARPFPLDILDLSFAVHCKFMNDDGTPGMTITPI
jgi:hypothetical protein